jgi:long-chain acyl-CoA synthetase
VRSWFTGLEPGNEVLLAALPFFHIFGLTVCLTWPVAVGGAIVLQANPRDIDGMIKHITKHRVTLFPALPALFNAINQYPGVENLDLSCVKRCFSGSAPLPEDVQSRFEELTGAVIVEGFGLTETSPVVTANPCMGKRKIGHIGLPIPSTDVRIVDPEGGLPEVPVGETGELIVRGPQVMKGYLNREQETSNTIRNGWLYTGDLAVMDEEGYFKIVGRKKDMIIASGYNVFPDEIDRILMAHEKVFESCTIGVPDQKRGETVKAFIVPNPGETVSEQELVKWCSDEMAAYKVPKLWEFREELPKSAMMKLLRRELRDEEIEKQGQADG